MITNFNLLRNIGQFDSVSTGAHLPLNSFSLIYAENGRGKTTIASILRSLGTGESSHISERHRLSASHPPEVVIRVSGATATSRFANGAWINPLPQIAIFDDEFISQNVFSGLRVENGHRENLHELILGARGIALNTAHQTHVDNIEVHNRELRQREAAIPASTRDGISVDDFCALQNITNITDVIVESERNITAARSSVQIRDNSNFSQFALSKFDAERINAHLSRGLPEIRTTAVQQVREHLASLGQGAEEWVSDGVNRVRANHSHPGHSENCPFCAQDLLDSPIFAQYDAYFSAEYEELRRSIDQELQALNVQHSEDAPARFERVIANVRSRIAFWNVFLAAPTVFILDTEEVSRLWIAARDGVRHALAEKKASPLETFSLSSEVITAIEAYNEACDRVATVSGALTALNTEIDMIKAQTESANLPVLEAELRRLRRIEARYSVGMIPLCQAYTDEKARKAATENLRDAARIALGHYRQTVFPAYELAINNYLGRFNAGFRIGSVASVNHRGGSSCTYNVVVNNTPVSLEGAAGRPSFRTTLSAGDRNTLALAFFFAALDQDQNLAQKIVIVDDPMTSLDEHRTLATINEMRQLVSRVTQVIVLSHSKSFLLNLWTTTTSANKASIRIVRDSSGSTLANWDVNGDCVTEHDRRYALVQDFINTGSTILNERNVAMALRPMLESFARVAYPDLFPPGSLLGSFLQNCRQRLATGIQVLSLSDLTEMQALLDYGNRFHHDTNTAYQTEAINDLELLDFSRRTVRFIKRT